MASSPSQDLMRKFYSLKHAWVSLCREPVNVEPYAWSHLSQKTDPPAQYTPSSSNPPISLGVCALQRLGVICVEQDRVKAQFVEEVCRVLENTVRLTASKVSKCEWSGDSCDHHHCAPASSSNITQIVALCRGESVT